VGLGFALAKKELYHLNLTSSPNISEEIGCVQGGMAISPNISNKVECIIQQFHA
jgi:hypothetical protein